MQQQEKLHALEKEMPLRKQQLGQLQLDVVVDVHPPEKVAEGDEDEVAVHEDEEAAPDEDVLVAQEEEDDDDKLPNLLFSNFF